MSTEEKAFEPKTKLGKAIASIGMLMEVDFVEWQEQAKSNDREIRLFRASCRRLSDGNNAGQKVFGVRLDFVQHGDITWIRYIDAVEIEGLLLALDRMSQRYEQEFRSGFPGLGQGRTRELFFRTTDGIVVRFAKPVTKDREFSLEIDGIPEALTTLQVGEVSKIQEALEDFMERFKQDSN